MDKMVFLLEFEDEYNLPKLILGFPFIFLCFMKIWSLHLLK